jgi:uncharacterized protein (DUF362 family)
MIQVAISHGINAIENVETCISKLGEINQILRKDFTVFIKPDLNLPLGPPVTIHPQVLGSIVKLCQEKGAKAIYIGFNPFDGISSRQLLKLMGLDYYLEHLGATILTLETEPYSSIEVETPLFFKNLSVPDKLLHSDVFISVVAPRTDVFGEFSLGLKNYFDLLVDSQKQQLLQSGSLTGLLDFYKKFPPHLTIWDAMTIGEGQGPFNLRAVPYNLVLASNNLLAGDNIVTRLMGADPFQVEMLKTAMANHLGPADPKDILVIGENVLDHCKKIEIATRSSTNISKWIEINEGTPCIGCQICLRYFLDFLLRFIEKDLKEFGGFSVFLGKFHNNLTHTIKTAGILFGNCAISSNLHITFANTGLKQNSIFKFPGCPPLNLRSIEQFCLEFKENLPSLEIVEEFIRKWTIGRAYKNASVGPINNSVT